MKKALVLARAFGRGVFRASFNLAEGSERFGDSFLEVIDNRGNINLDPVAPGNTRGSKINGGGRAGTARGGIRWMLVVGKDSFLELKEVRL